MSTSLHNPAAILHHTLLWWEPANRLLSWRLRPGRYPVAGTQPCLYHLEPALPLASCLLHHVADLTHLLPTHQPILRSYLVAGGRNSSLVPPSDLVAPPGNLSGSWWCFTGGEHCHLALHLMLPRVLLLVLLRKLLLLLRLLLLLFVTHAAAHFAIELRWHSAR